MLHKQAAIALLALILLYAMPIAAMAPAGLSSVYIVEYENGTAQPVLGFSVEEGTSVEGYILVDWGYIEGHLRAESRQPSNSAREALLALSSAGGELVGEGLLTISSPNGTLAISLDRIGLKLNSTAINLTLEARVTATGSYVMLSIMLLNFNATLKMLESIGVEVHSYNATPLGNGTIEVELSATVLADTMSLAMRGLGGVTVNLSLASALLSAMNLERLEAHAAQEPLEAWAEVEFKLVGNTTEALVAVASQYSESAGEAARELVRDYEPMLPYKSTIEPRDGELLLYLPPLTYKADPQYTAEGLRELIERILPGITINVGSEWVTATSPRPSSTPVKTTTPLQATTQTTPGKTSPTETSTTTTGATTPATETGEGSRSLTLVAAAAATAAIAAVVLLLARRR